MTDRITNRVQVTMDEEDVGGMVYIWPESATLVYEMGVWSQMHGSNAPMLADDTHKALIETLAGRTLVSGDRWVVETTTI